MSVGVSRKKSAVGTASVFIHIHQVPLYSLQFGAVGLVGKRVVCVRGAYCWAGEVVNWSQSARASHVMWNPTLETTDETLAASPLRPPPAQRLWQEQRGRASLVVDMHYAVEADNASEKHLRGRHHLCICCVCATCCVVSIRSPVSVATEQKISKDDWNKKLNTSFMNRKS